MLGVSSLIQRNVVQFSKKIITLAKNNPCIYGYTYFFIRYADAKHIKGLKSISLIIFQQPVKKQEEIQQTQTVMQQSFPLFCGCIVYTMCAIVLLSAVTEQRALRQPRSSNIDLQCKSPNTTCPSEWDIEERIVLNISRKVVSWSLFSL